MVTTTGSKAQYTANGTSTAYAYNFRILSDAQLVVVLTNERR